MAGGLQGVVKGVFKVLNALRLDASAKWNIYIYTHTLTCMHIYI